MKKKRTLSPEHLAKLQAGRLKKQQEQRENPTTAPELPQHPVTPLGDEVPTDTQESVEKSKMQQQIDELMETQALLKAALLRGGNPSDNVTVGQGNKLVGEVDKYLVDSDNYPDPTPRLAAEPRLLQIAFEHNYELDYEFKVRAYETKTGLNMREPEFTITLNKIVLDDQGNRVMMLNPKNQKMEEKRYRAKRLMFHEDPQAALVIARENNLDVDKSDEKTFLNEMRYYRVRDWLFGVFWPQPITSGPEIREEAIGGTLVQVFTKSSVEPSAVDFDQLQSKVQA